MKFTEFSLRNPLVVAALTLAVALFGLSSYLSMGIGLTPNLTEAVVTIVTPDAGADPATIETQVTKPIESRPSDGAGIREWRRSASRSARSCCARRRW